MVQLRIDINGKLTEGKATSPETREPNVSKPTNEGSVKTPFKVIDLNEGTLPNSRIIQERQSYNNDNRGSSIHTEAEYYSIDKPKTIFHNIAGRISEALKAFGRSIRDDFNTVRNNASKRSEYLLTPINWVGATALTINFHAPKSFVALIGLSAFTPFVRSVWSAASAGISRKVNIGINPDVVETYNALQDKIPDLINKDSPERANYILDSLFTGESPKSKAASILKSYITNEDLRSFGGNNYFYVTKFLIKRCANEALDVARLHSRETSISSNDLGEVALTKLLVDSLTKLNSSGKLRFDNYRQTKISIREVYSLYDGIKEALKFDRSLPATSTDSNRSIRVFSKPYFPLIETIKILSKFSYNQGIKSVENQSLAKKILSSLSIASTVRSSRVITGFLILSLSFGITKFFKSASQSLNPKETTRNKIFNPTDINDGLIQQISGNFNGADYYDIPISNGRSNSPTIAYYNKDGSVTLEDTFNGTKLDFINDIEFPFYMEDNSSLRVGVEAPIGLHRASRINNRVHRAIDLEAPIGSKVKAIKDSYVVYSGIHSPNKGFGETEIHLSFDKNDKPILFVYAHIGHSNYGGPNFREVGEKINKGDFLGTVQYLGNSKESAERPHLHLEVHNIQEILTTINPNWKELLNSDVGIQYLCQQIQDQITSGWNKKLGVKGHKAFNFKDSKGRATDTDFTAALLMEGVKDRPRKEQNLFANQSTSSFSYLIDKSPGKWLLAVINRKPKDKKILKLETASSGKAKDTILALKSKKPEEPPIKKVDSLPDSQVSADAERAIAEEMLGVSGDSKDSKDADGFSGF